MDGHTLLAFEKLASRFLPNAWCAVRELSRLPLAQLLSGILVTETLKSGFVFSLLETVLVKLGGEAAPCLRVLTVPQLVRWDEKGKGYQNEWNVD